MMETNDIARLVGLLRNQSSNVRQSSINVIATLAKFGKLLFHFVLCED